MRLRFTYPCLAGNEGTEKMEATIIGYIGSTRRIHSFTPSLPEPPRAWRKIFVRLQNPMLARSL